MVVSVRSEAEIRVELQMSRWAERGGSLRLRCVHNVPPELLYKVEFLRHGIKIFQYVKDRKPPYRNFTTPGAVVDISSASHDSILLHNMDFSASGMYSCEVSIETPIYTKASSDKLLTIIQSQKHLPHIAFGAPQYTVGDWLEANCTTAPAHPSPHIAWYVNGKRVDDTMVRSYTLPYRKTVNRHRNKSSKNKYVPENSYALRSLRDPTNEDTSKRKKSNQNFVDLPSVTYYTRGDRAQGKVAPVNEKLLLDDRIARVGELKELNIASAGSNGCNSLKHLGESRPQPNNMAVAMAPNLSIAISTLRVAANGRLDLACVATIPAYVGPDEHFFDIKKSSVTVDVIITETPTSQVATVTSVSRMEKSSIILILTTLQILLFLIH